MASPLYWVHAERLADDFPDTNEALTEPDGLLAAGGDLSPERLLSAYKAGIFPWFSDGQPILWWAPNPRSVLFPEHLRISRSLKKTLRQQKFQISVDRDFEAVMRNCAAPRNGQTGTWINQPMLKAYTALHRYGYAHSIECWQGRRLVGGLYGVAIGRVFFGESMFSHERDSSKVALVHLVEFLNQWQFSLIDCQVHNAHLESLGARTIERERFNQILATECQLPTSPQAWQIDGMTT